jgi:hypothetical protein
MPHPEGNNAHPIGSMERGLEFATGRQFDRTPGIRETAHPTAIVPKTTEYRTGG